MAEETGIAWTDSTFNPWRGCMKVSEGCKNCYAEQLVTKRQGLPVWGQDAQRIVAAESTWKNPVRWNKEVAAKPYQCTRCHKRSPDKTAYCLAMIEPDDNDLQDALKLPRRSPKVCGGEVVLKSSSRVFCASLADIFERYEGPAMDAVWAARTRLFVLVKDTPNLTWQFLTKRPENIMDMVPQSWRESWPRNVWIGCTVESQKRAAERLPHLLRVPAAVRFVSYEPALEPVDWTRILLKKSTDLGPDVTFDALKGWHGGALDGRTGINWLIVGGESGPGARQFNPAWADWTVTQCKAAGVPVFVKQMGSAPTLHNGSGWGPIRDSKGGDWSEWPAQLRVREFPRV